MTWSFKSIVFVDKIIKKNFGMLEKHGKTNMV